MALPWLSYATISLKGGVIVAMAFISDTRSQFWQSLVTLALILLTYEVRKRRHPSTRDSGSEPAPAGASEEADDEHFVSTLGGAHPSPTTTAAPR